MQNTITSAQWTRQGNVIVKVKSITSFINETRPVTTGPEKSFEVEIQDKSIFETENKEAAREAVYASLAAQGLEMFVSNFNID